MIGNVVFRLFFSLILFVGLSSSSFAQDNDTPADTPPDETEVIVDNVSNNIVPIPMEEWHKRQNAEERLTVFGDDLFGEAIDPHTGTIVFETTDVSLPGNFKLPVALSRRRKQGTIFHEDVRYGFGDWELQVPRIELVTAASTGWSKKDFNRCSNEPKNNSSSLPNISVGQTGVALANEYSNGISLEIPGQGSQSILYGAPASFPSSAKYSTTGNWYLTCVSLEDGGQGFKAYAPNGDNYRFDKFIKRDYKELGFFAPQTIQSGREKTILLATQVYDVHRNRVDYTYSDSGNLTRIEASDGRIIELEYGSGEDENLITSITSNPGSIDARSWTYSYGPSTFRKPSWEANNTPLINIRALKTVTQPDGESWGYQLDGMTAEPSPGEFCGASASNLVVTHPYGAEMTIRLRELRHRQSLNAPIRFMQNCPSGEGLSDPNVPNWPPLTVSTIGTLSVVKKTIEAANASDLVWTYQYEQDDDGVQVSDHTNWTKVTDPSNDVTTYYHFWPAEPTGGMLDRKTIATGNVIKRTTQNTHVLESANFGTSFTAIGPRPGTTLKPARTIETAVSQDGDTFTNQSVFGTSHSSGYSFGQPIETRTYSNVSTTPRITETTYEHKTATWVLSLPKTISRDGIELSSFTYNEPGQEDKGRVITETRFGEFYRGYTYNNSTIGVRGLPKRVEFPGHINSGGVNVRRYYYLTDWKRGTPQTIESSDGVLFYGVFRTQTVDDNGWVTSSVAQHSQAPNGTPTSALRTHEYERDEMGRLVNYSPPSNVNPWADTEITYDFSSNPITQTINKAAIASGVGAETSEAIIKYDNLFREIATKTNFKSGGSIYRSVETKKTYDPFGRAKDVFYPYLTSESDEDEKITTTYDTLGRVLKTKESAAVGSPQTQTYEYLSGHRVKVTDGVGAYTITHYSGYDGPSLQTPLKTESYSANGTLLRTTVMTRNKFDNITNVTQSGNLGLSAGSQKSFSQTYQYDSQQRLCHSYVPESGNTLFQYNLAGELEYYARGVTETSCVADIPSSSKRVRNVWDRLGRLLITVYSDAPNISNKYDIYDNLIKVSRAQAVWNYTYNDLNMLESEKLDQSWTNTSFEINYGYNDRGELISRTLPSGDTYYYDVDGAGRPLTIAGPSTNLADGITYHASGQVDDLNYGNGLALSQALNERNQLQRKTVGLAGFNKMDLSFAYSPRNQVESIADHVNSTENRTFTYDGLSQLKTANGPWGSSVYSYDSIGNILSKTLGNKISTWNYDADNRLSSYNSNLTGNVPLNYDERGNVTELGNLKLTHMHSQEIKEITDIPNFLNKIEKYRYDGNYKRVMVLMSGQSRLLFNVFDRSGTLVHVYDHYKDEGTDYVQGPSGTFARVKNGEVSYLHSDHLGSAQLITDNLGDVVSRRSFDPFGDLLSDSNEPENANQAGFTGHIKDETTKLSYMQARYYSPKLSRFLSVDPVTFMDTGNPSFFNRYRYCANDPVNCTDPTGTVDFSILAELRAGASIGQARASVNAQEASGRAAVVSMVPGVGVATAIAEGAGAGGIAAAVVMEAPIAKPLKAIKGAAGGTRAGKKHTRAAVRDEIAANAKINGGTAKCVTCKTNTTPATRRTKGSTVAPTEAQGAHIKAKANDGDGATVKDRSNVVIQCASCNNKTRTNDVEFN